MVPSTAPKVLSCTKLSASAKFTTGLIMPSQRLAPLDASSWTLGFARPTQNSWTLDHRCFASFAWAVFKRCTKFDKAVVSFLRADMELLARCRALKQQCIVVLNLRLVLVWRCRSGTRILLSIRAEMDQKPICYGPVVKWRPHLHRICSKLKENCTITDAERLAMIAALVQ